MEVVYLEVGTRKSIGISLTIAVLEKIKLINQVNGLLIISLL